jgi:hypothetical protein
MAADFALKKIDLPLHLTLILDWYIDAVAMNCIDLVFPGMVGVVLSLDLNRREHRSGPGRYR